MSTQDSLLALFKANTQLQMTIGRLLQESGQNWLGAAQHFGSAGLAQTTEQLEGVLDAGDWTALMALSSETISRSAAAQASSPQALTQIAAREQVLFTNGLQRALVAWQQAVTEALRDDERAASFVEMMRQWGRPWTDAPAASKE